MNTTNPYADLILELQSNHIYPATEKTVTKKSERVTGLSISCPSILRESRLTYVQNVIGDKFSAQFIPNKNVIVVTLKKK